MAVTTDLLMHAYRSGVFPMAEHRDDPELFWVDPKHRGIIPLDGFHISRSLARSLKRGQFTASLNQDFRGVLEKCADRAETWINQEIAELYQSLHTEGAAHSVEIWENGDLVGGVYGVVVGRAFCGESMFSRRTDASKAALAYLIDLLNRTGFTLFDTQFLTPHLATLGAIEIPRSTYRRLLAQALQGKADITSQPIAASGYDVVQRNTQTS